MKAFEAEDVRFVGDDEPDRLVGRELRRGVEGRLGSSDGLLMGV